MLMYGAYICSGLNLLTKLNRGYVGGLHFTVRMEILLVILYQASPQAWQSLIWKNGSNK